MQKWQNKRNEGKRLMQEQQTDSLKRLVLVFMRHIILPFEKCMGLELSIMQFRALCSLAGQRNQKMTDLAEHLCVSKQQVTQIVDRMIQLNFFRRVEDPNDRRCVRVDLTEYAEQFLKERLSDYVSVVTYDLQRLPKPQQKKFWLAVEYLHEVLPLMDGLAQSAQDVFDME